MEKNLLMNKTKSGEYSKSKNKEGLDVSYEEKDGIITYTIGNNSEDYSVEPCGGPHAQNTSELGQFKIKKKNQYQRA